MYVDINVVYVSLKKIVSNDNQDPMIRILSNDMRIENIIDQKMKQY